MHNKGSRSPKELAAMRKRRSDNKNAFVATRVAKNDLRIATCTDCKYGIFKDRHTYVWTTRGLVHESCA